MSLPVSAFDPSTPPMLGGTSAVLRRDGSSDIHVIPATPAATLHNRTAAASTATLHNRTAAASK